MIHQKSEIVSCPEYVGGFLFLFSIFFILYLLFDIYRMIWLVRKKLKWQKQVYAYCVINTYIDNANNLLEHKKYNLIEIHNSFDFNYACNKIMFWRLNKIIKDNWYYTITSFFKEKRISNKDIDELDSLFEMYKTTSGENYIKLINNFIEEKKWQWNVKL